MRLRKQAMPGARVGGLGPCAVADCGYGGWFAGSRGRQRGAAFGVVARPWRDRRRMGWVVALARPAVAGALVSAGPARSWRLAAASCLYLRRLRRRGRRYRPAP